MAVPIKTAEGPHRGNLYIFTILVFVCGAMVGSILSTFDYGGWPDGKDHSTALLLEIIDLTVLCILAVAGLCHIRSALPPVPHDGKRDRIGVKGQSE